MNRRSTWFTRFVWIAQRVDPLMRTNLNVAPCESNVCYCPGHWPLIYGQRCTGHCSHVNVPILLICFMPCSFAYDWTVLWIFWMMALNATQIWRHTRDVPWRSSSLFQTVRFGKQLTDGSHFLLLIQYRNFQLPKPSRGSNFLHNSFRTRRLFNFSRPPKNSIVTFFCAEMQEIGRFFCLKINGEVISFF